MILTTSGIFSIIKWSASLSSIYSDLSFSVIKHPSSTVTHGSVVE
jgi:hypothetical protein